ncbi:protein SFI1 homolog [Aplysia californica]|uniref:Protein SFI1 homolog n=1 Tax=Aplysia californica TaxID=6500 RepID=A0ABM1A343_APLCA|nr:protein SFI1 homolog [Aplysia californica]
MSEKGQFSGKNMKQDIMAELSSALTVRAEQIRSRLASEREIVEDDSETTAPEVERKETGDSSAVRSCSHAATLSQIPVSQARLRRRQERGQKIDPGRKGTVSSAKSAKVGSTVDIKNYRPGYTWSIGGRLKELRIRCIARKFLYIWLKGTFGRVLPSAAMRHYKESLMRKMYNTWYDYWWEIVMEWRLSVRAECHYRYKLWYVMFVNWRKFVDSRKSEKIKEATSDEFHKRCQLTQAWHAWRDYVSHRHRMQVLRKRARQFRGKEITRLAWGIWKERLNKARQCQEDVSTAVQFWNYRIQAQHWLVWKAAFAEQQRRQQQYVDACVYHNSILVSRCLKAWLFYVRNRRAKKAHSEFAVRVYHSHLKLASFNHWHQRWHLLRSLQQHHMKMEALSTSFRLRWVIWRWRHFISLRNLKREREAMADQHYCSQLVRFGMDSFRLNVVHSNIKEMRIKLALHLRVGQLQRWAWQRWKKAQDIREEGKISAQTEIARERYRVNIMGKCFSALKNYAHWRQLRKLQHNQAEAHYYLRTMPRCLFHMHMFVELERKCRENAQKAQEFHRCSKLEWVFSTWVSRAKQERDARMMHRMAVLHRESVLLQSFFSRWRQQLTETLHEADKLTQAECHYVWSVGCRAWTAWRMLVQQRKTSEMNRLQAVKHHHLVMEKVFFQRWRQKLQLLRIEKQQTDKAVRHRNQKTYRACIKQWKSEVAAGRQFRKVATERFSHHQQRQLKSVFSAWRETARELGVVKRKKIAASVHHNRCLMLRVVQAWQRTAALQAYRGDQQQRLLQESIGQLQHLKLSLYWKRWLREKERASKEASSIKRADEFYQQKIACKVWTAWNDYSKLCLRKRLIGRQSQWFHDVRVTAKSFLVWRHRLQEQQEENNDSQLALWHWSLVLQRKVLVGWWSYVERRRHKKARLTEAASLWRQQLLRNACGQWLATADSLSHMRSVMAARHQASSAFESFHLVQRCAVHWKLWARRRAASRGDKVKRDKTLTLTSTVRLEAIPSIFPVTHQTYPGLPRTPAPRAVQPKPLATVSPARPHQPDTFASLTEKPKSRLPPKRPSFLVDSLKRAGLFSELHDGLEPEKAHSEISERLSTPSLSDLRVDSHTYPEYPSSGRFVPHTRSGPTTQRSRAEKGHSALDQDWSLSAEVLSGSTSTLGTAENGVKPLILSNSDTEPSGAVTGSSTSHSPHMFTPSTQRSQFSGNPLLYSSPVSEKNTARETGRFVGTSGRPEGNPPWDSHRSTGSIQTAGVHPVPGMLDLNTGSSTLLMGNLEGLTLKTSEVAQQAASGTTQRRDQWLHQLSEQSSSPSQTQRENVVLLKPEDFMKKSGGDSMGQKTDALVGQPTAGTIEGRRPNLKRTPRNFAVGESDQSWGLPPVGDFRAISEQLGAHRDSLKDGQGAIRHTPREMSSPRRTAPQGILHKVSDSDGDVSPLNTARSRGTVTFASPKSPSPEEEIINIRDRLRHFSQQKEKLRSLRRQYRQLSDWLAEQSAEEMGGDEDSQSASQELDMLRSEVADLQGVVDSQRPICERLVLRAQTLAQELHMTPA